jgi:dihydroflavonol-4-reductase
MSQTVLVTGGSGFVASWCIVDLLQRGYAVRTTVRSSAKEPAVRKAIASAVDPGDRLAVFVADLTSDTGWDAAVAGCDYVLHVASPLGGAGSHDPDSLIKPARDGALRVLRAAVRAGVKRVVMTSSVAASSLPVGNEGLSDETVWTDPHDKNLDTYRLSKTLAERAAWDFIKSEGGNTTLVTVLPGAVLGPVLSPDGLGSVQIVQRMLNGKMPGTPRVGFSIVDVRDVADMHVRAMTTPAAAGQRFIAAGDYMWLSEIAAMLKGKLGARAAKVPTRGLPDFVLRLLSIFDRDLKVVTPTLGQRRAFSSAKAQAALGWAPRPAATTVVDCAESLIAKGAV